ncbi:hypothetical protein [Methylocystis parvus]|uniref:hypothetical protein n=1 Tax=Methylocystis parvus TaxID=134 RepID=UPI003C718DFD
MSGEKTARSPACEGARFSFRDVAIVIAAIAMIVLGNCGVVRALDIALDAIRR